jgi:hypothetical protein
MSTPALTSGAGAALANAARVTVPARIVLSEIIVTNVVDVWMRVCIYVFLKVVMGSLGKGDSGCLVAVVVVDVRTIRAKESSRAYPIYTLVDMSR